MKKRLLSLVLVLVLGLGLSAPAAAAAFSDVPATHWAHDSVAYVVDHGLFSGTGGSTFSPDSTMTRSMLAYVLYRYAGSPAVSRTAKHAAAFSDIPEGAYYADAVAWAVEHSIFPKWFLHYDDFFTDAAHTRALFCPDQVTTRADFAIMLYHFSRNVMHDTFDVKNEYFQYVGNRDLFQDMAQEDIKNALAPIYPDFEMGWSSTLETANIMICWAYAQRIMTGTSASTMSPAGSLTRAETAVMLTRYHQKYGAPDGVQEAAS